MIKASSSPVLDSLNRTEPASRYLQELKKLGVDPNFWCSDEYLQKAGCEEEGQTSFVSGEISDLSLSVWDGEILMFPPIQYVRQRFAPIPREAKVWSDFLGYRSPLPLSLEPCLEKAELLDLEYIFDPQHFQHMDGGKWMVFRKNCRKWPKRNTLQFSYTGDPDLLADVDGLRDVLMSWLGVKGNENIHDDEVLVKYLLNGNHRKILLNARGEIVGINIWDYNWKYINFRYCICRPEPFLPEYMRWLFYSDPLILGDGRKVNDGGILDKPSLKDFKDKMNPCQVREVYSWQSYV